MLKCPNCGSIAQFKLLSQEVMGNDLFITIKRIYSCGCKITIKTVQHYEASDKEIDYEIKTPNLFQP